MAWKGSDSGAVLGNFNGCIRRGRPPGRVIVWVDDSLASLAALRRAVAEARRADTILYPVRMARTRLVYLGNMPPPPPAPVTGVGERRVRTAFDLAMGGLPAGVEVRVATVRGTPGRLLVELADRDDDLLVVGDDWSFRPWWATIWPSIARYCTRRAKCAVVLTPPPPLARTLPRVPGWWHRLRVRRELVRLFRAP